MTSIADNIWRVRERIQKATLAAGRKPEAVCLLGVSKTRSARELRQAARAGLTRFGENYLQEALDKMAALADVEGIEWHFIGPIQSNKSRPVAEHFHWVHSLDRAKVARRLNEQRPPGLPPLNLCIQVNLDAETSKAGVPIEKVEELAEQVAQYPRLRLRGLMAIPDPDQPATSLQQRFHELAAAMATLRARHPDWKQLDTLSMGMSNDLEQAIAEGATIVRVGTALFGPRNTTKRSNRQQSIDSLDGANR